MAQGGLDEPERAAPRLVSERDDDAGGVGGDVEGGRAATHLDVLRRDYRSAIGGAANNSWWHSHRRRYSALNATTMPAFSRRCHEGLTELVGRDLWPPKPPTRAAAERDLELRANATRLIAFPDPEREEKIQRRLDRFAWWS